MRKVVTDSLCPICNIEAESVSHILWECPSAADVWGVCDRGFQKCTVTGKEFRKVAEFILEKFGTEKFALFVGISRRIWFRRNVVVHGGEFKHPN